MALARNLAISEINGIDLSTVYIEHAKAQVLSVLIHWSACLPPAQPGNTVL